MIMVEDAPEGVVKEIGQIRCQLLGGLLELGILKKLVDLGAEIGFVSQVLNQFTPARVTEITRETCTHKRHQPIEIFQE